MQEAVELAAAMRRARNGGPLSFSDVLNILGGAGNGSRVTVQDLMDAFGRRAFGPFLLIPAVIAILPVVGALPGVSTFVALIEVVVALELALGTRRVKLPGFARRLAVPRWTLKRSIQVIQPFARWVGRFIRPRLQGLSGGLLRQFSGLLALALAILMLIGAMLPGTIVPPAIAMILLSLGLTSRDGLLVLIAAAIGAGSIVMLVGLFPKVIAILGF